MLGTSMAEIPEDPHAAWLREVRSTFNLMSISLARERRRLKRAKQWVREVKRRVRAIKRLKAPVRHLLESSE